MRLRFLAIGLLATLATSSTLAQQAVAPLPPATDTVAPDIPGVVRAGSKVQVIKTGLTGGTEGPIALNDDGGAVLFTEQQANRISKIDRDGNFSTFLENITGVNAITIDPKGRMIALQRAQNGGKAQIAVIYPKGQETVLSDAIDGKPILNPNDLIADKKGGVYFTVPGAIPPAVYYITPAGKTVVATEAVERPNGIQLNRTETILYVASGGDYMRAFDIQPDGSLTSARNFAKYNFMVANATTGVTASGADGITIDTEGRLYTATNGGVEIFTEQGQYLGVIPLARKGQNLGFAGPDKKTLYVVGTQTAWKIEMLSQGFLGRAK
ncbi:MAG: SMP-30/gluconolactonase/LRE family protein [Bauldia sp.]